MKRSIFVFFFLIGCTTTGELLTQEFAGNEVFLCCNYNGITPGKKIIKMVDISKSDNSYYIDLQNDKREKEQLVLKIKSTNYTVDFKNQLDYNPFCSQTEYEKQLQAHKRQLETRIKIQKKLEQNIADCKQAISKSKQRRNEINKLGELFILDKTTTLNQTNHTSNWSHCLKVIDFAKDGILLKSNCTSSPVANLLLEVFVGCEDKYYFIYTSDKYADGECYKDWRYLHRDVGVYNWEGKRIRAFKKTNFKVSEIEYQTYLKNKTLKCCTTDNNNVKICN